MPYRFKIDEPVEKGFRRIAREQLDIALGELAAPEIPAKGVHECRKAMKRLRALVRLAGPALGKKKAQQRNKALAQIAHLLAARRDEAVMLDTVARLSMEGGSIAATTLLPLHAHLVARVGGHVQPLVGESAATARLLLLQEAKKFSRVRFKGHGFAALCDGLEQSYRTGRRMMRKAYGEPTDENFHTLRKAVQWHWRQMSLLARAWPDEFAVRAAAARELSQILGDDHDLAMLIETTAAAQGMSDDHKDGIVALCLRRQNALRDAAEYRAERLFAETSSAFVKRMSVYWKYGRVRDPRAGVQTEFAAGVHKFETAETAPRPAAREEGSAASKTKTSARAASQTPSQRRA